jgi:hypothetical protein
MFKARPCSPPSIRKSAQEDALYETARQRVEISEEVLMQKFGIDRMTAQYWVSSTMGG